MWSILSYMVICIASNMFNVVDNQVFRHTWYVYNCMMSTISLLFSSVGLYCLVRTVSHPCITSLWIGSKYLEWCDTVFLTLAGKDINILHYWHHATTVILFSIASTHNYDELSEYVPQWVGSLCNVRPLCEASPLVLCTVYHWCSNNTVYDHISIRLCSGGCRVDNTVSVGLVLPCIVYSLFL